jgi:cyclopropane-fatty-acyl-phospholipid synthase
MAVNLINDVEARQLSLKLLETLFKDSNISVRLWDGTLWNAEGPSSETTLVLRHPGALRAMLLPGTEIGLIESYLYDDIDIEGDFEGMYAFAENLAQRTINWTKKLSVARDLMRLPDQHNPRVSSHAPAKLSGKRHSIERDRQAIAYHYNVSNDFYKLFLGKRMVYSCAYFRTPEDDLDTAQEQKLDLICRKLRLKPGQRVLDLGCGWGGLAIYAAQTYGVDVTGITLSQPQMELASQRIAAAGMSQNARVFLKDYREIDEYGKYDALVSVGMFEQVGEALLPVYFERAYKLLKPGGVFLNHGIARRWSESQWDPQSFSDAYVFPDGELLPISHTLNMAEKAGFEVRDVESLREHYAHTLHHWVENLIGAHEKTKQFVDEPTYRVWRVYMAGSEHGFIHGRLNIYQSLLVKPNGNASSGLPLTREDWYRR